MPTDFSFFNNRFVSRFYTRFRQSRSSNRPSVCEFSIFSSLEPSKWLTTTTMTCGPPPPRPRTRTPGITITWATATRPPSTYGVWSCPVEARLPRMPCRRRRRHRIISRRRRPSTWPWNHPTGATVLGARCPRRPLPDTTKASKDISTRATIATTPSPRSPAKTRKS